MQRYSCVWTDKSGGIITTSVCAQDESDGVGILSAIAGANDAGAQAFQAHGATVAQPVTLPTVGGEPVYSAAQLTFTTPTGATVVVFCPAAGVGWYLPDGETVDPSGAAGDTIAACLYGLRTVAGELVGAYQGGHRVRMSAPDIPGQYS